MPQVHNQFADALATLASMVKLAKDMRQLCIKVRNVLAYCINIKEFMNVEVEINGKPWNHDIKAYMNNGEYPSRAMDNERKFIRSMACQLN